MVVLLSRLTRWPLHTILPMTMTEACVWLATATEMEKEINRM